GKIIAAPFAFVGSIGVVAQLPNFHRLLKKHDIDYEVLTAGEHKRTMTVFGKNTDKDREKFVEDLQETHDLFKQFVTEHRPVVNIETVATGEVWLGARARDMGLVDEVMTSDEYINAQIDTADIFAVRYRFRKSLPEKVGRAAEESVDSLLLRWVRRLIMPRGA
ncbi:MAG TPA: S49 family peptidase, partial [Porticoccaceae bacterium]